MSQGESKANAADSGDDPETLSKTVKKVAESDDSDSDEPEKAKATKAIAYTSSGWSGILLWLVDPGDSFEELYDQAYIVWKLWLKDVMCSLNLRLVNKNACRDCEPIFAHVRGQVILAKNKIAAVNKMPKECFD